MKRIATIAGLLLGTAIGLLLPTTTVAQSSSLMRSDGTVTGEPPLTLQDGSWYYRRLPPPRKVELHDLVTIRVDETAQAIAEGEMETRNSSLYNAILANWVYLEGLTAVRPNEMSDGSPQIQGQLNELYRKEAELETGESLKFRITAKVVDIRPNGNLVLEAHKMVRNNNEVWEYSLTGICRAEDVDPNTNTILSEKVADLSIFKRERGHVRDGYRRGWFLRWFQTFNPF
jgi:flagellar L-ring protein precursor FlgH